MLKTSKSIYFYIDTINQKFPGYSKIIDNIVLYIPNAKIITSLNGINNSDTIVPVGVNASLELLKKSIPSDISFLVDAPTLGFLSIIKFYFKKKKFINNEIVQMALRYVKYSFIERRLVKSYKKVVVVSNYDRDYLKKRYHCQNIFTIANGADMPKELLKEKKSFNFTLGFLYYWGVNNSIMDIDWFIKEYLPILRKKFPKLRIVAAGKGAGEYAKGYFNQNNIEFMGEVNSLDEFYNEIDIYITTVRKECGILNKVLDSFAHKKTVIALQNNMLAFSNLENGFLTYNSVEELISKIEFVRDNQEQVANMTNNAYDYIVEKHDWKKNYSRLNNLILIKS